jgi:2-hydroxy-3-keto-5-methylthiopentenyl-1-phosphate phosphatase
MALKLFIDFDGTMTRRDIGDLIFRELGIEGYDALVHEYLSGKVGGREYWVRVCQLAGAVDRAAMEESVDAQEMEPTFFEFMDFSKSRNLDFFILSDGFDFYIDRVLKKFGLEQVRYFSNRLEFQPVDGTGSFFMRPAFPYSDEECTQCANCKRNHLLTLSSDDDIIVYIGDGYSDICPTRYADIVFAKKDLIRYCQRENISYYEYRNFRDVIDRLEKILTQKRIRKRRQAELRRREAFLQG